MNSELKRAGTPIQPVETKTPTLPARIVEALLVDLDDRSGFGLDDEIKSFIRPDWTQIVEEMLEDSGK